MVIHGIAGIWPLRYDWRGNEGPPAAYLSGSRQRDFRVFHGLPEESKLILSLKWFSECSVSFAMFHWSYFDPVVGSWPDISIGVPSLLDLGLRLAPRLLQKHRQMMHGLLCRSCRTEVVGQHSSTNINQQLEILMVVYHHNCAGYKNSYSLDHPLPAPGIAVPSNVWPAASCGFLVVTSLLQPGCAIPRMGAAVGSGDRCGRWFNGLA